MGWTVLSLFIAHNTNPFDVFTPITSSITNRNTLFLPKHQYLTSPQCQIANNNKYGEINRKLSDQISGKYAFIHCIDLNIDIIHQLYGIIAFHGGLQRVESIHDHIVLIPLSERKELLDINSNDKISNIIKLLTDSMSSSSKFKVITFDSAEIDDAFTSNPEHNKFRDTFHRAYAFKSDIDELLKYDKLLLVKSNMVILSNNIDMIFNYPSPSAPPQRWSGLESNIACFLYSIKNDDDIYDKILKHLANDIYIWYDDDDNKNDVINNNDIKFNTDSWNSERGTFQSLINAIYWQREYGFNGINQIHQKYAINTNKLSNRRTKYFIQHRQNMLYMIEFVDDYPPTRKARDRCNVRSKKKIDGLKMDWFEIIMNSYFVQFWLDLNIICNDNKQYQQICDKLELKYKTELDSSLAYKQKFGYPYPYINQS